MPPSNAYLLSRVLLWLLLLTGCGQGATCDLVLLAQVSLERRGQVFMVPVTIDGQPTDLILDTGAQKSL